MKYMKYEVWNMKYEISKYKILNMKYEIRTIKYENIKILHMKHNIWIWIMKYEYKLSTIKLI